MTCATPAPSASYVGTATYSPEDNKLRLYPFARLDTETYARVKSAGFSWAPKQHLFVAPKWTPSREDLLTELCGEVGDEDKSLVDRAEERAHRFSEYQEKRLADAESARAGLARIADGIPLGQPILIGHHSERHARKDVERIENGMRRAVKMWETSQYWQDRAAGALAHAKYKELPEVRARRIKTIEAEIRSLIADYTPHKNQRPILQSRWNWKPSSPDMTPEQRAAEELAARIPHVYVGPHGRGGRWVPEEDLPRIEAGAQRWLLHLRNRLEYEKAMLAEGGGLAADKFSFEVGGRVLSGRDNWYVITGINRKDGHLLSLSTSGGVIPAEEIKDYRAPAEGDAEKVKKAKKLPPLVNFRAPGCVEMTTAQWKQCCKCSDTYYVGEFTVAGEYNSKWASERKVSAYRQRTTRGGNSRNYERIPVFLTDAKVVEPPKAAPVVEPLALEMPEPPERHYRKPEAPSTSDFDALRESLKNGGVQVVSAPQLFPTPPELARRMTDEAGTMAGCRILEPSAGTGRLIEAAVNAATGFDSCRIVAVECNLALTRGLEAMRQKWLYANESNFDIRCSDFLECTPEQLGQFDRILMNPPFADGQDIEHVRHAHKFLKPGGRLVAIMCEGPFFRQDRKSREFREWLDSIGGTSEQLPPDTFRESGTGVMTRLVVIDA